MTKKKERPVHFLNLDDLAHDPHIFEYGGKEYKLKVLTTREFLKLRKTLDTMKDIGGKELTSEAFEASIEFIKPVIPDFPVEELDNMSTAQLTVLFQFCAEVITGPTLEEVKKVRGTKKEGS